MGAQQIKLGKEPFEFPGDELQRCIVGECSTSETSRPTEYRLSNEIYTPVSLASLPKHKITVAGFAKIKTEPISLKEKLNDRSDLNIADSTQPKIVANENVKVETEARQDGSKENLEAVSNITVPIAEKRELLVSQAVVESNINSTKPCDVVTQNTFPSKRIGCDRENPDENDYTIKIEVADDFEINENLANENIDRNSINETITPRVTKRSKFVKNPFSYLRKNNTSCITEHLPIEDIEQDNNFVNIKSESIVIDSDSENENATKSPVPTTTTRENLSVLKDEAGPSLINLKESNIKSENLNTFEDEENYKSIFSNFDCLSPSLNSSLNVNASSCDTDSEDILNKQWDVKSNISLNSAAESFSYFSTIEMSSVENEDLSVRNLQSSKNIITPKKRKRTRKGLKLKKLQEQRKTHEKSKTISKTVGKKIKAKQTLSKKYTKTDGVYGIHVSKKTIFTNLPKSNMKTRKQSNKYANVKNIPSCTKEDFPKPFKLEPLTSAKGSSEPVELPKPMMFKNELAINTKNKKFYLKPEFQPYIHLKRLKSEELLVPLKSKCVRKSQQFKSTTNKHKHSSYPQMDRDIKQDFLIHRAYSLNTCTKCNRFGMDHDYSYCNAHNTLNNRQMPSYSMLTNTPNGYSNETDSKYFTPQELFSLFHSSTPDSTSEYSGGLLDSGVSTSTRSVNLRASEQNKTLLLEIAAERAFINNHLMYFGYSPIQFELFNNLNDLSNFVKYLFGNANPNYNAT